MFITKKDKKTNYQDILFNITLLGNVISKIEESSMSVGKMLVYLNQSELSIITEKFIKNLKLKL